MKVRSADLDALWQGICHKHNERVPRRWRAFFRVVYFILAWGNRK